MAAVVAMLLTFAQVSNCPSVPAAGSPVRPECECQSLQQLLGPSEPELHMVRPLWRIRGCPRLAATVLSEAVRSSSPVRDTADLERRTWLTHYIVDDDLISAALDVVRDSTATPQSRVYAVRTLIWQRSPGHLLTYEMLAVLPVDSARIARTVSSYTGHYYTGRGYGGDPPYPWPVVGRVPPAGYLERTAQALRGSLQSSKRLPASVANAMAYALALPPDEELIMLLGPLRTDGPP